MRSIISFITMKLYSNIIKIGDVMKKLFILLSFCVFSLSAFSEIKDNSNLFDENQKKMINEKIEEIKKERNMSVFVNTFDEDIGFVISNPERAFILNLKKIEEGKYKVELSFSRDIDIEDYNSDINEVLEETTKLLEEKKYSEYIIAILDEINVILQEIKIEPLEKMTLTKNEDENIMSKIFYYFLVSVAIILILLVIIKISIKIYIKNKK